MVPPEGVGLEKIRLIGSAILGILIGMFLVSIPILSVSIFFFGILWFGEPLGVLVAIVFPLLLIMLAFRSLGIIGKKFSIVLIGGFIILGIILGSFLFEAQKGMELLSAISGTYLATNIPILIIGMIITLILGLLIFCWLKTGLKVAATICVIICLVGVGAVFLLGGEGEAEPATVEEGSGTGWDPTPLQNMVADPQVQVEIVDSVTNKPPQRETLIVEIKPEIGFIPSQTDKIGFHITRTWQNKSEEIGKIVLTKDDLGKKHPLILDKQWGGGHHTITTIFYNKNNQIIYVDNQRFEPARKPIVESNLLLEKLGLDLTPMDIMCFKAAVYADMRLVQCKDRSDPYCRSGEFEVVPDNKVVVNEPVWIEAEVEVHSKIWEFTYQLALFGTYFPPKGKDYKPVFPSCEPGCGIDLTGLPCEIDRKSDMYKPPDEPASFWKPRRYWVRKLIRTGEAGTPGFDTPGIYKFRIWAESWPGPLLGDYGIGPEIVVYVKEEKEPRQIKIEDIKLAGENPSRWHNFDPYLAAPGQSVHVTAKVTNLSSITQTFLVEAHIYPCDDYYLGKFFGCDGKYPSQSTPMALTWETTEYTGGNGFCCLGNDNGYAIQVQLKPGEQKLIDFYPKMPHPQGEYSFDHCDADCVQWNPYEVPRVKYADGVCRMWCTDRNRYTLTIRPSLVQEYGGCWGDDQCVDENGRPIWIILPTYLSLKLPEGSPTCIELENAKDPTKVIVDVIVEPDQTFFKGSEERKTFHVWVMTAEDVTELDAEIRGGVYYLFQGVRRPVETLEFDVIQGLTGGVTHAEFEADKTWPSGRYEILITAWSTRTGQQIDDWPPIRLSVEDAPSGQPTPSDRDGDGWYDDEDWCPDTPGKFHGCPDQSSSAKIRVETMTTDGKPLDNVNVRLAWKSSTVYENEASDVTVNGFAEFRIIWTGSDEVLVYVTGEYQGITQKTSVTVGPNQSKLVTLRFELEPEEKPLSEEIKEYIGEHALIIIIILVMCVAGIGVYAYYRTRRR